MWQTLLQYVQDLEAKQKDVTNYSSGKDGQPIDKGLVIFWVTP